MNDFVNALELLAGVMIGISFWATPKLLTRLNKILPRVNKDNKKVGAWGWVIFSVSVIGLVALVLWVTGQDKKQSALGPIEIYNLGIAMIVSGVIGISIPIALLQIGMKLFNDMKHASDFAGIVGLVISAFLVWIFPFTGGNVLLQYMVLMSAVMTGVTAVWCMSIPIFEHMFKEDEGRKIEVREKVARLGIILFVIAKLSAIAFV